MFEKEIYYWGSLRITNKKTIQKWKEDGKWQELLNKGYIYADGYGRFRTEHCHCCKCKSTKTNN